MDENHNKTNMDPWDPDFYETGSTKPPKSRGGIIAILLAVVIFLGGLASAMSILNIRMIRNNKSDGDNSVPIAFHEASTDTTEADRTSTTPAPADASGMTLESSPPSVENVPQEGGLSLQEIYSGAIDSVVSILCATDGGQATGTGVIFNTDGYIVTNAHVVAGAQAIQVLLNDGQALTASLVGTDSVSDLAVLLVKSDTLKAAEFGDSSVLRVGDAVVAIGDPLGIALRGTMTDGIISAINRDITTGGRTMTVIQTNAALNSGNSGGPLLNCYGQVIGINTMKIGDYMNSNGVEGLGFAIPTTTVQEIVNQLIGQGYVSGRPSLGITGESVPYAYQRFYNMPAGLYITGVEEDSAADEMGIEPGDILVSIDKVNITDGDTLNTALYAYQAGDTVELIVFRSGRYYSLELTLNEATG